ncbi:MAG: hypothetical protein ABIH27_07800, partial [Candidatus Omnitrophota bacterium]
MYNSGFRLSLNERKKSEIPAQSPPPEMPIPVIDLSIKEMNSRWVMAFKLPSAKPLAIYSSV